MSFPGRRGNASVTDFHLYPLTFRQYVDLIEGGVCINNQELKHHFQNYIQCGGYLRAVNDLAKNGKVLPATFMTYEQWIRGDFLRNGKNEQYLLAVLNVLMLVGVSQCSYSTLTQKIGLMSKETCIDYCGLLERMDILLNLKAFDQNKKQGFPKKNRKFHFSDPFIRQTIYRWLHQEGYVNNPDLSSVLVEACVASHCSRFGRTFYYKASGEIDVIWIYDKKIYAIEVKWSEQVRANDFKMLKQFENAYLLGKNINVEKSSNIKYMPVYQFLYELKENDLSVHGKKY